MTQEQIAFLQQYFALFPGTMPMGQRPGEPDAPTGGFLGTPIPEGFVDVYGPPPNASQFRGILYGWQMAQNEYKQWLAGFRGLIKQDDPDWVPLSEEARTLYRDYDMGHVLFFRGKIGISATFDNAMVKHRAVWAEPNATNKQYPTPLRPFRWEGDSDARDDIENAHLVIATYQVRRLSQGLPVAKPIFANIAPKNG